MGLIEKFYSLKWDSVLPNAIVTIGLGLIGFIYKVISAKRKAAADRKAATYGKPLPPPKSGAKVSSADAKAKTLEEGRQLVANLLYGVGFWVMMAIIGGSFSDWAQPPTNLPRWLIFTLAWIAGIWAYGVGQKSWPFPRDRAEFELILKLPAFRRYPLLVLKFLMKMLPLVLFVAILYGW
jgi:hypothetical protein